MMLAKMFDQTNTKPSCCNELEELVAGQKLFNQSLAGVSFGCIFYAANPLYIVDYKESQMNLYYFDH